MTRPAGLGSERERNSRRQAENAKRLSERLRSSQSWAAIKQATSDESLKPWHEAYLHALRSYEAKEPAK